MGLAEVIHVQWPESSGVYKVVQFISDNQPYLRLKPMGDSRHSAMVLDFARDNGIKPILRGPTLILLPEDCKFKIVGMGRVELGLESNVAEFFGASSDYKMPINESHLALVKEMFPEMNIRYNPSRII